MSKHKEMQGGMAKGKACYKLLSAVPVEGSIIWGLKPPIHFCPGQEAPVGQGQGGCGLSSLGTGRRVDGSSGNWR